MKTAPGGGRQVPAPGEQALGRQASLPHPPSVTDEGAQHPRSRRTSDGREARRPRDMNRPGLRLHPLTGDRRGQWSVWVWVSGNWRIVFRFVDSEAVDVDLVDYHGR